MTIPLWGHYSRGPKLPEQNRFLVPRFHYAGRVVMSGMMSDVMLRFGDPALEKMV